MVRTDRICRLIDDIVNVTLTSPGRAERRQVGAILRPEPKGRRPNRGGPDAQPSSGAPRIRRRRQKARFTVDSEEARMCAAHASWLPCVYVSQYKGERGTERRLMTNVRSVVTNNQRTTNLLSVGCKEKK